MILGDMIYEKLENEYKKNNPYRKYNHNLLKLLLLIMVIVEILYLFLKNIQLISIVSIILIIVSFFLYFIIIIYKFTKKIKYANFKERIDYFISDNNMIKINTLINILNLKTIKDKKTLLLLIEHYRTKLPKYKNINIIETSIALIGIITSITIIFTTYDFIIAEKILLAILGITIIFIAFYFLITVLFTGINSIYYSKIRLYIDLEETLTSLYMNYDKLIKKTKNKFKY